MEKYTLKRLWHNSKESFYTYNSQKFFLYWPFFIFYYFILRQVFGLNYFVIYGFSILLIFLRLSFETIAMIFFSISLIVYFFGLTTEANHYFSFVYGFLVLSVLKYFYFLIKERYFKDVF
ncbi:MAG: hypothetical protein ACD_37C00446G0001 [uncultured bacterium]|nr:MAG: hypothetical protein ACD_37C00446G0001 [uncultured bacterium]